jgi:hypothetical protein
MEIAANFARYRLHYVASWPHQLLSSNWRGLVTVLSSSKLETAVFKRERLRRSVRREDIAQNAVAALDP